MSVLWPYFWPCFAVGLVVGVLELTRDAERMGQVSRADEENIHAVDRGDPVGVAEPADRFDLDDPDDAVVQPMDIGVRHGTQPGAADAGTHPLFPERGRFDHR